MNNVLSFDQLPQMVCDLTQEVKSLKAMVTLLLPKGSCMDELGNVYVPDPRTDQGGPAYQHILCNIQRAMEITKKAKSTIYQLVRNGEMPGMKKGKRLYFYEDELAAWIETGRRQYKESQDHEATLRTIRAGIRRKPKSLTSNF